MEVAVAIQSGTLLHALRILQRRRVPPTEEWATTKSLKLSKRRAIHPRAITWPHFLEEGTPIGRALLRE